ncbi:DUF485 domain-containing protein [Gordonia sp. PKS22-38]|uniref:DUF485 domain-containing protein n=1 Tax=Gordonia prachuapensis TaxID=3115651 RepID=A0ABU7MTD0_9ACTN|nr:DUF485 domain-containing protein [Gordonia sp. PKS22-38]
MDDTTAPQPNWSEIWEGTPMRRLRDDRRSFFALAWSVFSTAFCLLLGFVAFAPDIVSRRPIPGLSIGIMLGLLYVVTVMALGAWYVRRARRWDQLADDVLTQTEGLTEIRKTGAPDA